MPEYDSLSRDELIEQLEARDWLLGRYRRMTEQLERDIDFFEESFSDVTAEVDRLRDERDTDKQFAKTTEEIAELSGADPEKIRDGINSVRLPEEFDGE